MQGETDIVATLEEAIDALLKGDRPQYNHLTGLLIAEVRVIQTYKYLVRCMNRRLDVETNVERVEVLRTEVAICSQKLRDLKQAASRPRVHAVTI